MQLSVQNLWNTVDRKRERVYFYDMISLDFGIYSTIYRERKRLKMFMREVASEA